MVAIVLKIMLAGLTRTVIGKSLLRSGLSIRVLSCPIVPSLDVFNLWQESMHVFRELTPVHSDIGA